MSRKASRTRELERHIMRCRRRGERASLLAGRVGGSRRSTAHRLACCFRMTDSVLVTRMGHGYVLAAIFDDDGLERAALEQKVRAIAGAETRLAWVRFPDDGVTLDALLKTAWTALEQSAPADPGPIIARAPA